MAAIDSLPSLADAAWLTRLPTQRVLRALADAGHESRIVGGAVRNALLGKPVSDIDIATPATPTEVTRAAKDAGLHVVPTGIKHGTVTVVAEHVGYEVTTLRHDVETDGRHATVAFTTDWAADAARRDFTINALYCDATGTVYDPLGGYLDLAARRVRFVGSADQRIAEDYLRILRFFRFHAEHGHGMPDAEGLAACVRGRHGLARLSAERVRAELVKLLVAPGAVAALRAMHDHGLLVALLGSVPRLAAFGRLVDIGATLGRPASPPLRLGVLALRVTDDAARLANHLRLANGERDLLEQISGARAASLLAGLDEAVAKPLLYCLGTAAWGDAVLARWAWSGDATDSTAWRVLLTLPERWPPPVFPLRGADLLSLGLAPGPAVGETLRRLEDAWIAAGFSGTRDDWLAQARNALRAS